MAAITIFVPSETQLAYRNRMSRRYPAAGLNLGWLSCCYYPPRPISAPVNAAFHLTYQILQRAPSRY